MHAHAVLHQDNGAFRGETMTERPDDALVGVSFGGKDEGIYVRGIGIFGTFTGFMNEATNAMCNAGCFHSDSVVKGDILS